MELGNRLLASEHFESFIYLLDGKTGFFQNISTQHVLSASDSEAKTTLFADSEDFSNDYAEAMNSCEILIIRKNHFDDIIFGSLTSNNTEDLPSDIETSVYQQIDADMKSNTLYLPSLPEIALRVRSTMKK